MFELVRLWKREQYYYTAVLLLYADLIEIGFKITIN